MDRYRIQLLSQEGQDNLFPLIHAESLNTIDLNNIKEEGIFYFNSNNSATNAPTGATSGFGLQILRLTDSNYLQIAYLNNGSGILQTRIYNGSSWTPWLELSGGEGGDTGNVYWNDILNKPTWITTVNNNDMTGLHSLLNQSNLQLLNVPVDQGFIISAGDWSSTSNSLQSTQVTCEYPYYEYSNGAFTRDTYNHTLKIEIPKATENSYGVVKLGDISSGGSSVSVQAIQTSGTHIATITVDGDSTQLFAPTSGGASLPNITVVTGINDFEENRTASSVSCSALINTYNLSSGSTSDTSAILELSLADSTHAGIISATQYGLLNEYSSKKNSYITNSTINNYIEDYISDNNIISQTTADNRYVNVSGDTMTGPLSVNSTNSRLFSLFNGLTGTQQRGIIFQKSGSSGSENVQIQRSINGALSGGILQFNIGNGQIEFFTQCNFTSIIRGTSGSWSINTSGAANFLGNVTGAAFYQSSDRNSKENIEAISNNDIDKAKDIELVSYNFKDDTTKRYGVIAQDIEEKGFTNLVHTDDKGKKTVDYISLLILKIEQLQKEVNELKSKVYGG